MMATQHITPEIVVNCRRVCLPLTLSLLPLWAIAGNGLVAPTAEMLWPQWQARVALYTATTVPISLTHPLDGGMPQRYWQGGSVVGDFFFARPTFGSFRAVGGVVFGAQGGLPLLTVSAGPRLGLSVQGIAQATHVGVDTIGALPYLGLGFSSGVWSNTLSVSADVGFVAERPGAAAGLGRALLGNQALDGAVRELRMSPLLQLGVHYRF